VSPENSGSRTISAVARTKRPRALLYIRLSVSDDASTSIARQEADLRDHAEREGWDVVGVFADDGISGQKVRKNAARALDMVRDDEVDVLAVWKFDRWSRQGLGAVADLIAALDRRPEALFVALRDGLRSDQPAWRIIASVLAEVARMEADNTRVRVRSAISSAKRQGKFPGGVVPFGYRPAPAPDGQGRVLELDSVEVPVLAEVAKALLGGASVNSQTTALNEAGVPTSRSKARRARQAGEPFDGLPTGMWTTSTVQSIWTSDTLLGRVVHGQRPMLEPDGATPQKWPNGAPRTAPILVTDEDGRPVQFWPKALDAATIEQLRAVTRSPRAVGGAATPTASKRAARLLSGVVYCAHCDGKMYVNNSGPKAVYACPKRVSPDCPAPRMTATIVEAHVEDVVLRLVGTTSERRKVIARPSAEAAELADVAQALATAYQELDAGATPAQFAKIERLQALRTEIATRARPDEITWVATGRTVREAWFADEDMAKRRELVRSLFDHITVSKLADGAPRKGKHLDRIKFIDVEV
jgi:site-specific DNA recombinase